MVRRLIATVALVGCAGIYALAANERATFILTNGDRKTGTLVHHGGNDTNLIDANFNLGTDDGKEQSYPESQVAVIDFAGGQPSANELQAMPGSGHFLVLRNGQSQNGQFVNIAHGNTLLWKNASGEQQQYAVTVQRAGLDRRRHVRNRGSATQSRRNPRRRESGVDRHGRHGEEGRSRGVPRQRSDLVRPVAGDDRGSRRKR